MQLTLRSCDMVFHNNYTITFTSLPLRGEARPWARNRHTWSSDDELLSWMYGLHCCIL